MANSRRAGDSMRLRLGTFLVELSDSRLRVVAAALIAGVCAGAVEFTIHETLRYSEMGQSLGGVADSAFVGLAAASVAGVWLLAARERRKRVLLEMRKLAELNHNVRNALQVIAHSHYGSDDSHTEMVLQSVERIERTLNDLFPVEQPKEGSPKRRL